MNGCTFSASKTGVMLAKELEGIQDGGKSLKFVSSVISKYSRGLKDIDKMPTGSSRESLLMLWREQHIDKVDKNTYLSDYIKSLVKNILVSKTRNFERVA